MRTPVSVAVVGLESSGPQLALAFDELAAAELRWIHDPSPGTALGVQRRLPGARLAREFDELLHDEELDAVAIATPAASHCDLVRRALNAGKHVLVEPPLALYGAEAEELVALAERTQRRLMTGHPLLFHPAARELKAMIDAGRLGDLYYLYGSRQCLAPAQPERSVVWGPGTRLVSMLLWLVGDEPIEATARGGSYRDERSADVAFCHLRFATGIECELQLSSLEPRETRRLTAVGSAGMGVFDELHRERMLTFYDRRPVDLSGARRDDQEAWVSATVSPARCGEDPLRAQCEHFATAVRSPGESRACGREAAAVVAVLEALERSLARGGRPESVGATLPAATAETPPGVASVIQLPIRSA